MKTRFFLSALILTTLLLILFGCQKGNPITPETPDTTPPSAIYAKSIKASPDPSSDGNLVLFWGASKDDKSGVAYYEVHVVSYTDLGDTSHHHYSEVFTPAIDSLPLRGLPAGGYVVDMVAVDHAGNKSTGPLPRNGDLWGSASFRVLAH